MKHLYLLTACIIFLMAEGAHAQFDSLQIKFGTNGTVASNNYQPLWLVANRYGTITDQQTDLSSYISFSNKHVLGSNRQLYNYLRKYESMPEIGITYGFDLYINQHFSAFFIQQGYVKVNVNHWQLRAGRYEEIIGEVNPELSSGSLGVSGNALPIPKVSLAVTEYTEIPFTQGWIQFKGLISHGWMRGGIVENALLHEKNLYLRAGNRTFGLYGGFNHFVIWGGKHPVLGQFPQSFGDFWTSVFGQITDMENLYDIETEKKLGNHLGFVDYGINVNTEKVEVKFYNQVPFENGSEIYPFSSSNKLVGLSLENKTGKTFFSAATIEYINTINRDIDQLVVTFDNYYNNGIYQTGWSYLGNIIGTPLFFDRQRADQYHISSVSGLRQNIVNNRVRGVHLGVKGNLPFNLSSRTLLTYTENYGNSYNTSSFFPNKKQWYFMQELLYQYEAWRFNITLGWDVGELTNNVGALLGIEYDLGKALNPGQDNNKLFYRFDRF